MRFFSALSSLLLVGAAAAQGSSSCAPSSSDLEVAKYAWSLQFFLERFYASQPLNQTFLSGATNSSTAEYFTNLQGIQRQNRLGVRAVQQLGSKIPGFESPRCNYTFPTSTNGESYIRNSLKLESSVASAFIGLAGYTQSPEVSFLCARLAAQHTSHATWLAAQQAGVVFPTNSTSLVPAYNPSYVLASGNQPGKLGDYFHGCVTAPSGPCGEALSIGPLIATLGTSANATASQSVSSALISPTAGAAKKLFSG